MARQAVTEFLIYVAFGTTISMSDEEIAAESTEVNPVQRWRLGWLMAVLHQPSGDGSVGRCQLRRQNRKDREGIWRGGSRDLIEEVNLF